MGNILRRVIVVFLILSGTTCVCAQNNKTKDASPAFSPEKCLVAFYTQDSIAIQLEGGQNAYDHIARLKVHLQEIQMRLDTARDSYLHMKDDSALSATKQGRDRQQNALVGIILLRDDSILQINDIAKEYQKLQPTFQRIRDYADTIAHRRGIHNVYEASENRPMPCPTDQTLMVDITNDILTSLGMKPYLLRVGTFNTDSLMRLMPGYAKLADSTVAEMKIFNDALAKKDAEIAKMQHELDSLRPGLSNKKIKDREEQIAMKQEDRDIYRGYELYKVDLRDSMRVSSYNKKFRAAASSAAKDQSCLKYYDQSLAHNYWTTDEAEFIDLNAEIAAKLK